MGRKKHEPPVLTLKLVREQKGYENLTDEEAQNIIDTLMQFAYVSYQLFKNIPHHEQSRIIKDIQPIRKG